MTFSRPARPVDTEKIPPEHRALVSQPPGRHDQLSERLVQEGGFTIGTSWRLPACPTHQRLRRTNHPPAGLVPYRVATRRKPQLSRRSRPPCGQAHAFGMAQLHPKTHPGEVAGRPHARVFTVNRTHIAAVSVTGAAHAVTQQPSHHYDELHLLRAHNSYFVAYLLAKSTRLVLEQFQRAHASLSAPAEPSTVDSVGMGTAPVQGASVPPATTIQPKLLELRRAVVRFGLTGEQLEISSRSRLRRYYRVSRDASAVQGDCAAPRGN